MCAQTNTGRCHWVHRGSPRMLGDSSPSSHARTLSLYRPITCYRWWYCFRCLGKPRVAYCPSVTRELHVACIDSASGPMTLTLAPQWHLEACVVEQRRSALSAGPCASLRLQTIPINPRTVAEDVHFCVSTCGWRQHEVTRVGFVTQWGGHCFFSARTFVASALNMSLSQRQQKTVEVVES